MAENGRDSGENQTRKQDAALAALLSQPTMKAAAKAARVSETTLFRWLREDAGFQGAYREARRESVNHAITRLQTITGDAVDTLAKIMKNTKAPYTARVTAARAVIEYSLKATELEDLAVRVAELEAIISLQEKKA